MEKENDALLDAGAAALGAAVGSGVGAVVAGPVGAVGGATLGALVQNAVQWIGKEIKDRQLSKREEKKIGTVYELAKIKIEENMKEGKTIRSDSFFSSNNGENSSAEEVTEEVLFAAQRESEEKKLPFLSNLYANIFFDTTVDKPMAFQLLRIAEQLTYRHIQIITIIGGMQLATESGGSTPLKKEAYKTISGYKNISIATDIFGLYRQGIIQSKSALFDPAGITPSDLSVGGCGALLFNLMELSKVPFDTTVLDVVHFLSDNETIEMSPLKLVIKNESQQKI